MRFPCKSCGVELENPGVFDLVVEGVEFFWQECPECGCIKRYSWLRIEQIVEET